MDAAMRSVPPHGLSATRPGDSRTSTIINEAKLWNHRIHLLQDNKLRPIRWHAIKNR